MIRIRIFEKHVYDVFHKSFVYVRPKKISLVSGYWSGETFFYHSPAHIVKCESEYKFLIKKHTQKNTTKRQKAKETKEVKRISVEKLTRYVCEFLLYTFNLLDRVVNFSWLLI